MSLSIIEAAASARLTTLDMVKADLGLTGADQDAYIGGLIDQASAAIASWCARVFAAETVQETFRVAGCAEALLLSRWPVIDLVSIEIDGQALAAGNVETEAGGLLYRLEAGRIRVPWRPGQTVIVYRGGYVLPDAPGRTLPSDIERAALLAVRSSWHARGRDPTLRSEAVEGVGSATYFGGGAAPGLPGEAESLLWPYRAVAVA